MANDKWQMLMADVNAIKIIIYLDFKPTGFLLTFHE